MMKPDFAKAPTTRTDSPLKVECEWITKSRTQQSYKALSKKSLCVYIKVVCKVRRLGGWEQHNRPSNAYLGTRFYKAK
jgi:hypothetical protein